MNIILAKTAGFCFGVKKAVEKVYECIETYEEPIYTFGPIIHNEIVVKDLEKKGIKVIETKADIEKIEKGIIIIRSHGVPKEIYDIVNQKNLKLVDTTCPFVKKIHSIVNEQSKKDTSIIIIGDKKHPEVKGIIGWCVNKPYVIENEEQADSLKLENKAICIVSQTTFNYNKFNYLVEILSKKGYDSMVINTICNATNERQIEAKDIASKVDGMLVIGGQNSSNSTKLYEICKKECKNTYFIQSAGNLDSCSLKECKCIGITAGASTPNYIIEEVQANVRLKF